MHGANMHFKHIIMGKKGCKRSELHFLYYTINNDNSMTCSFSIHSLVSNKSFICTRTAYVSSYWKLQDNVFRSTK